MNWKGRIQFLNRFFGLSSRLIFGEFPFENVKISCYLSSVPNFIQTAVSEKNNIQEIPCGKTFSRGSNFCGVFHDPEKESRLDYRVSYLLIPTLPTSPVTIATFPAAAPNQPINSHTKPLWTASMSVLPNGPAQSFSVIGNHVPNPALLLTENIT